MVNTACSNNNVNILVCGIGGQGVVLAGKIISRAAFESGMDIKTSEVHGMSQRGGSVSTHIRYGEKIYSPIIPRNQATILLSFDIYETARFAPDFAGEETVIISSGCGKIPSWTPKCQTDIYTVSGFLETNFKFLNLINDKKIARDLGNIKVSNIVLIGLLSVFTQISEEIWINAIKKNVPKKTVDININAFLTGKKNYANKIF